MEVDTVVRLVGVTFVDKVLRDTNHVVNVFRASRIDISPQDVQGVHVLVIGLNVLLNQGLPVSIEFVGSVNDFVVNIGEILHIMNIVTACLKPTMNQIERQVAPSMTKMTAVVYGDTTYVHGHLSGSSVVKFTFSRRRVSCKRMGMGFNSRCDGLHLKVHTGAPLPWPMEGEARQRIFVLGVNGHIGNHIVRDLLENGYRVRGSVRDLNDASKTDHVRAHAAELGLEDRLELVEGDVLEADGWSEKLEGCDGLFHTATMYSTRATATTILDTANKGTTHLLHAAAETGIQRVIYTSSTAAVGTSPKGTTKDESVWNTDTSLPYTTAKTQSERLAWNLAEELGLDLRVINPTAVLGGGFVRPTPSVDFFGDAIAEELPCCAKVSHVGGSRSRRCKGSPTSL